MVVAVINELVCSIVKCRRHFMYWSDRYAANICKEATTSCFNGVLELSEPRHNAWTYQQLTGTRAGEKLLYTK